MQQDMEDFQASGAGFEGANLSKELLTQINPDRHKPRIGTTDHENHVKNKTNGIEDARQRLEKVYGNQARAEAAATTAGEPNASRGVEPSSNPDSIDPTYSPTGIPIRRAESSMAQNSSSTSSEATEPTSNPDQHLVVRKAASAEKASQATTGESKPIVMIGSEGQSRKLESSAFNSSETSQPSSNTESSPSVTETTTPVAEATPSAPEPSRVPERVEQPFVPVAGSIEEPELSTAVPEVSSTSSESDDTTKRTEQGAPEPERQKVEHFTISGSTEKNYEKSGDNQDAILEDSNKGLMAVFDGMGGHAAGREAAETAKRAFESSFSTDEFKPPSEKSKQKYGDMPSAYAAEEMTRALERADREIKDSGTGGGTTVAAVIGFKNAEGQAKAVIGHVGDSRVYRLSPDGKLEHLTLDDSEAIETVAKQRGVTPQEAQRFLAATDDRKDIPNNLNVITNSLGSENMEPHVGVVDVNPGDIIFATSDGIHDNLTDREIQRIIEESSNPQEAVARLTQRAGETSQMDFARSKDDDRSVVMMDVLGNDESQQADESAFSRSGTKTEAGDQAGASPEVTDYENQYLTLPDGTKVFNTGNRSEEIDNWHGLTPEEQEKLKTIYQAADQANGRTYRDPNTPNEVGEESTPEANPVVPEASTDTGESSTPEHEPFNTEGDTEAGSDREHTVEDPSSRMDGSESSSGDTHEPGTESNSNVDAEGEAAATSGSEYGDEVTPPEDHPEAEAQAATWEANIETARQELAKIHDALGRAFREGMEAVEKFTGTIYELSSERVVQSYKNWRHNSRRRSENYRKRMTSNETPDTKWQKIRLGMIERSEQRRAAFWDKWLGTRIGQEEEERPSGQEGRQRLINRPEPEESMDRAVRLLANLRNDQERFRGIGLNAGREKTKQIEDDFRGLVSQEVADKVEERIIESDGYKRAGDIIDRIVTAGRRNLDTDEFVRYADDINRDIDGKDEFASMKAVANGLFAEENYEGGVMMLDIINGLNQAHENGEISDTSLYRANEIIHQIYKPENFNPDNTLEHNLEQVADELSLGVAPEEIQATAVGSILDIMQKVDQAQAETKSTRRKNDGKIHQFLSSPGWKKTTGTVIAGAGTVGMLFTGPAGAVVAGAGIFMARQAGMRERVENTTNKKAGQQADLINQMTEDPLMRELYRRLDVTPHTQGGEVEDLPAREHIDRDDLDNFNARELAEALGSEEAMSDIERRSVVTSQIIDSLLRTSHDRARTKLMRRVRSTAFSAGASTLPVAATIGSLGGLFAGYFIALGSVGVPLFGAWRGRRQYAPPSPAG